MCTPMFIFIMIRKSIFLTGLSLFVTTPITCMQKVKPPIPRLKLPAKDYLEMYQHEIVHLDLNWKKSSYGSREKWYYGWPQNSESDRHIVRQKMLAFIESRLRNEQDLEAPIVSPADDGGPYNAVRTIMNDTVYEDGYLPITRKLLELGVDPNAVCYKDVHHERRPLERAALGGAKETVQLLLNAPNIDVHITSRPGHNSLLYYTRIASCISDDDKLHIMRLFLEAGVDPNAVNVVGRTELFNLAFGDVDMRPYIKLMCEYGLRTDIKDKEGRTAVEQVEHWRKINRKVAHERRRSTSTMCKGADIIQFECPKMILLASLKKKALYTSLLPLEVLNIIVDLHIHNQGRVG